MKRVIPGAGASYDSIHKYYDGSIESEGRPPLAKAVEKKKVLKWYLFAALTFIYPSVPIYGIITCRT